MTSSRRRAVAHAITAAYLAGAWTERAMSTRAAAAIAPRPRWLTPLTRAVLEGYHRPPADRPRELAAFADAWIAERHPRVAAVSVRRVTPSPTAMRPRRWPVAALDTTADLARALELDDGHLRWLADVRGLERDAPDPRLRHYTVAWRPRASGPPRPIEVPKRKLKEVQRWILREILDRVAPHPIAHGFTAGRSVVTNARAHVGRRVVLRFDLESFFASVAAPRVFGLFRLAGYPEEVAHVLTGLCTTTTSRAAWDAAPRPGVAHVHAHARLGRRLATPHLPQGAPTSPALANLAAFTLDRRLAGLAERFDATVTRYADDVAFSGGGALLAGQRAVRSAVVSIVREEGFALREDKSTLTTRAGRQVVCGVVVNERPNVARPEAYRLRALLHDALVRGPAAANRAEVPDLRAHVLGRIGWVASLNPSRGRRLREQFDRIDWTAA